MFGKLSTIARGATHPNFFNAICALVVNKCASLARTGGGRNQRADKLVTD